MIRELGVDYEVVRNDEKPIEYFDGFDKLLISPGPGVPENAGMTMEIIQKYGATKSILGVCLGHQAIAECYGAKLVNLEKVVHGKAKELHVLDASDYLFENQPERFETGRYHSWVVDKAVSDDLVITAQDDDGEVMAIKHKEYDVRGVQFHPESILTKNGIELMKNWIKH